MAKEFAKRGKVLILAPESIEGVDTLKRNHDALEKLYESGYTDAQKILDFIR